MPGAVRACVRVGVALGSLPTRGRDASFCGRAGVDEGDNGRTVAGREEWGGVGGVLICFVLLVLL